ncbi:MAG TPA: response regulator [Terriglobales bacterium]|nr:response regulator [Terriglobales bacterium]
MSAQEATIANTILCVSDQDVVLRMRKLLLEHEGFRVLTAIGEKAAEQCLRGEQVGLVLLDYGVAEAQRVAARIKALNPGLRIVLISFSPSLPRSLTGLVDAWVSKTRSPDVLLRKIEQLLGKRGESRA